MGRVRRAAGRADRHRSAGTDFARRREFHRAWAGPTPEACSRRPVDGVAGWMAGRLFGLSLPLPALSLADALIGAAAASGLLWFVAEGYFRLRGREGMGLGDVKMMAMAGAFLGLQRALLTILLGSLLGSLIGATVIVFRHKDRDFELPFGTFLGAGAILVVFFGSATLGWYRSFLALP